MWHAKSEGMKKAKTKHGQFGKTKIKWERKRKSKFYGKKCDDDMVWNSDKDVEMLEPGEYVMGDIHTLGWVIIKYYECVGSELKGYSKEVQNIVGKGTPFAKWNTIQNSEKNEMKSNHFQQFKRIYSLLETLLTMNYIEL